MKTYPESRLTDLLIEFDEMGFCPTTVCPNPEQTAIEWKEQVVKEIQKLQAENVELRERLEKAIELPLLQTIRGNKLPYEVVYKDGNGRIIVTKYRRWQKKQAEARLKEPQGGGEMKVIKMPNIKPIKCLICGCEYEYELGDELEKVNKKNYYGDIPGAFLYFLECPVCGTKNELCFDENEEGDK